MLSVNLSFETGCHTCGCSLFQVIATRLNWLVGISVNMHVSSSKFLTDNIVFLHNAPEALFMLLCRGLSRWAVAVGLL